MDVISIAKELGKAIQKEESYLALQAATQLNDENAVLQEQIERFNLLRMQLTNAINKEANAETKIEELKTELTSLYETITADEGMKAFEKARGEMEKLIDMINQVVNAAASGEDMDTFEPHDHSSCGGNCSSCGGCH